MSAALFAPVLVGTSAAQSAAWTRDQLTGSGNDRGRSMDSRAGWIGHHRRCVRRADPLLHAGKQRRRHSTGEPSTTVNKFNPYYFPWVVGSGQSVKGYFDYRPKNINEAVVAATSTNAGQSWTFEQMVEQLTTECPTSDSNTATAAATMTAKATRASSASAE